MIFYEIELLSQPTILFAYNVSVEKSTNRFAYKESFLELCLIEEGHLRHMLFDGTEEIIYPGMLDVIASDLGCDTASFDGERQRHTTVGVHLLYRCKRHDTRDVPELLQMKERIKKGEVILVPYQWDIDDIYHKTLQLITDMARLHASHTPSAPLQAVGKWYCLVSLLTDYVLRQIDKNGIHATAAEQRYARKAAEYIEKNYNRRLQVGEIADALQISEGHLHRIFKKVQGMGITEYLNRHRVGVALSLMEKRGLSLKEAAYNVGIEDPAYMSRLFKKVTGTSYRNYEKKALSH